MAMNQSTYFQRILDRSMTRTLIMKRNVANENVQFASCVQALFCTMNTVCVFLSPALTHPHPFVKRLPLYLRYVTQNARILRISSVLVMTRRLTHSITAELY